MMVSRHSYPQEDKEVGAEKNLPNQAPESPKSFYGT